MIGGARTLNYYATLDRFKLNLAGQELKEKKFDDYQRRCSDLDTSSLSDAVLDFYDVFTRRKNSNRIILRNNGSENKEPPNNLVDIVEELWEGISHPTTIFITPPYQELNKELLNYDDVRKELDYEGMKYISRDPCVWAIKFLTGATSTILGPSAFNLYIGLPIAGLGAILLYDSIKQFIAYTKHDKKNNFIHEKEFRKLFHCAKGTDNYMAQDIDLTPPGKPIALGGRGELEEEAIEIIKKLKRKM